MKGRVTVDRIRYDRSHNRKTLGKRILRHWELYLFLVPALVYIIVMNYGPMYGVLIAFQDYKPRKGMSGSEWVGLKHFIRLFGMANFGTYMKNTLILSFYSLLAGFPLPIVLALAMNSSRHRGFAKVVQTATYAPHFISMVVVVSMINVIFAPTTGIVSSILNKLGIIHGPLTTLMTAEAFPHLYVWSGVWQSLGWDSIIYMGALSSVDDSLHEAALIDGASPFTMLRKITLPLVRPTTVFVLMCTMANSFKMVDLIVTMTTKGGPNNSTNVLMYHIYQTAFAYWDIGKASVMTVVMLVFMLLVSFVQYGGMDRHTHYDN